MTRLRALPWFGIFALFLLLSLLDHGLDALMDMGWWR